MRKKCQFVQPRILQNLSVLASYSALILFLLLMESLLILADGQATTAAPSSGVGEGDMKCPDISPCTCTIVEGQIDEVKCEGASITETTISEIIPKLRTENGLIETDWLFIRDLVICCSDSIATLDLAPLFKVRLLKLDIHSNTNLEKVFSSKPVGNQTTTLLSDGKDADKEGSLDAPDEWIERPAGGYITFDYIIARNLSIQWNKKLTEDGVAELLSAFSSHTQGLFFGGNAFKGAPFSPFFAEFCRFTNLRTISLEANQITTLCKGLLRLKTTTLNRLILKDNEMMKIEPDSIQFLLSAESLIESTDPLVIDLSFNKLSEKSFPSRNFFSNFSVARQAMELYLQHNELTALPPGVFQDFLKANSEHSIDLDGNGIICEANYKQLAWLRKNQQDLSHRVEHAFCVDQIGHTVFTYEKGAAPKEMKCADVAPCTCVTEMGQISELKCEGTSVTETTMGETITKVREANGITGDDWLYVRELVVCCSDKIEKLDLSPLYGVKLLKLGIHSNDNLQEITSSKPVDLEKGEFIDAKNLFIQHNSKLEDKGISTTPGLFTPSLQGFYIAGNALTGSTDFPDLSHFEQLNAIDLEGNKISTLRTGLIQLGSNHLRLFGLRNNGMTMIEPDVITLKTEESNPDGKYKVTLEVDLSYNNLNQSSFPDGHFLQALNSFFQPIEFNLKHNEITGLPREPAFYELLVNLPNSMHLDENLIDCDKNFENHWWLRKNLEKYTESNRVLDAFCNDHGRQGDTVFNYGNEKFKVHQSNEPCIQEPPPENPETTTPPPSTTTEADETTIPPQSTTTKNEATTTVPQSTTTRNDGTTTVPQSTTTKNDGTTTVPPSTTTGGKETTASLQSTTTKGGEETTVGLPSTTTKGEESTPAPDEPANKNDADYTVYKWPQKR